MADPTEAEMMSDLAKADAGGDAALAQHIAGRIRALRASAPQRVGTGEAVLRGATQGATMGFGDEMEAGWKSLFPKSVGGSDYKSTRDQLRKDEQNAKSQHPAAYLAGDVIGGAVPAIAATALTGGAASPLVAGRTALGLAAGQGAVQGAGYSDAGDARSLARDTALGAGVGVVGYGAGEALGAGARGLAKVARARSTAAAAQATEKAAQEIASSIASAKGSLGGEVQKGQRIVENLRRLGPELSPEEHAAVDQLEQRLTQSTREALPGQVETIAAKDAELASLKSGASDALASRKTELLSTKEAKGQMLQRLLRYGPVAAGTVAGTAIGGPVGSAVGALAGAGTRPMIQSIRRLAKNPAVQKAVFDAVGDAAESKPGDLLRQLLTRGGASAATQSLVSE